MNKNGTQKLKEIIIRDKETKKTIVVLRPTTTNIKKAANFAGYAGVEVVKVYI